MAFADGSVQFFGEDTDALVLWAHATRADDDIVSGGSASGVVTGNDGMGAADESGLRIGVLGGFFQQHAGAAARAAR